MTHTPDNPVAWTEIPVRDLEKGIAFYKAVFAFDLTLDNTGPNPLANFRDDMRGVGGHLYPGTPSADGDGPTVHLVIPDTLEAAAERCWKAGGTVVGEATPLPVGRFQYLRDPDGNSV
ncbi:MAG: VOC family protein, partial [Pseudomonadota bacterium]